jgi:hypothetical protein
MIFRPIRLNGYMIEHVFLHWEGLRQELRDDKKIEIERFSLTSSKPFDQVVAALIASLLAPCGNSDALEVAGNLDMKVEELLRKAAS